MTQINLFQHLSTRSKRALLSTRKGRFNNMHYQPRMALLIRLSLITGLDVETVRNQLLNERKELLK